MQYKLVITGIAEQDLEDIAGYIANDLSSPKAAVTFLNDVDNCYENISLTPHMYPFCENERLKRKEYRKALIKNYIMFYRVDDKTKTIYVMRFIYGGRDYIKLL